MALSWCSAGAQAGDDAVEAARGVSLGRPVAVLGPPTPARTDPEVRQAAFQEAKAGPVAPAVRTAATPKTLPDSLHTPRDTPLPPPEPFTTIFATTNRTLGQPLAVASTPGPPEIMPASLTSGVGRYLASMREALGFTDALGQPGWETSALGAGEGWTADAYRWYGSAEYLLWEVRGTDLPPLVTTGPLASQGILGQPGTVVLFGGRRQDEDTRNGGRFTLGWWCDPCQEWGVEATYFFLGRRSQRFRADSDAFPLLARPFFNLNQGIEFSEVSTRPGDATGSVAVEIPSKLWGLQGNVQHNLCRGCGYHVDLLAGVRYLSLEEGLDVREDLTLLRNNLVDQLPAGTRAVVFDRFDTRNQFYGGQVGARAEVRRGPWFANVRGTVALGNTHQEVRINGGQVFTTPAGAVSSFRGGLLALPTNIGTFSRDRFAVVPEVGANLGYHVTPRLRLFVGYNFLYWSNVLRPGDQIDRTLDINQIPNFISGPPAALARPVVPFKGSDFWAQGVNFGVEFRY